MGSSLDSTGYGIPKMEYVPKILSLYTEKGHLDGCDKRSEDIKNLAAP